MGSSRVRELEELTFALIESLRWRHAGHVYFTGMNIMDRALHRMHMRALNPFGTCMWLHGKHGGNLSDAYAHASAKAPIAEEYFKAAIAAGSTNDPTWAATVPGYSEMTGPILQEIDARSLLGKLSATRAPFRVPITNVSGTTASFVGEGKPLPATRATLAVQGLTEKRIGEVFGFSDELFRVLSPAHLASITETVVRGMALGTDAALLSEGDAGDAPEGLLHDTEPQECTGADAAAVESDMKALFSALFAPGRGTDRWLLTMPPPTALNLSTLCTASGDRLFPQLSVTGGSVWGVDCFVTPAAVRVGSPSENVIVLLDGARIALADSEVVVVDSSSVAAIQLDDAPIDGASEVTSAFQSHTRFLRVSRFLDWCRVGDAAISWMAVDY